MPGHEFSTASVPPTMRCSSIVNVLAGPIPHWESVKMAASTSGGFSVVVASLVVIIVVVVTLIHSLALVKVLLVK